MTVYSYSRLETYKTCPLQFKFNYIDRIKSKEKTIEAFMGNRFHETMEKLYDELKFRLWKLEELLVYFDEIWEKNFDDNVVVIKKDRTVQDYKNLGRKCVEGYYKHYYPFDQGTTLGVEVLVQVKLDDEGKYLMRGYVDRVVKRDDGTYEIHDYKTAKNLPEQKRMDADKQLALYHVGLKEKWGDVEKVELVWHYVVYNHEIRSKRSEENLEDLRKEYIALIDKVEAETQFEPKESALCGWCSYQGICPKKKHLVKMEELPVNEYKKDPGVQLVKKFSSFEKEKSEFKTKIQGIEAEQEKIKEAAIEFAVKEEISVIDGPDAVLKVEIKEELKGPTKTKDPENTEKLKETLIAEGKLEEVATVSNPDLIRRVLGKEWPENIIRKVEPFLYKDEKQTVKLAKKKDIEK